MASEVVTIPHPGFEKWWVGFHARKQGFGMEVIRFRPFVSGEGTEVM